MGKGMSHDDLVGSNGSSLNPEERKHRNSFLESQLKGYFTYKFRSFDGKGIEKNNNYGILPVACIHRCFLFCDLQSLFNGFLTCQLFYQISSTDLFWKEYYGNFFYEEAHIRGRREKNNYSFEEEKNRLNYFDHSKKKYFIDNWKQLFFFRLGSDRFYRLKYGQTLDHLKDVPGEEGKEEEEAIKIALLGETFSGKTTYIIRLMRDELYDPFLDRGIGATFYNHYLFFEAKDEKRVSIKLEIWDTSGVGAFKSMIRLYYRESAIQMVFYSIVDEESFEVAKKMITEIERNINIPNIVLIGSKLDLEKKRTVKRNEVIEYCEQQGIQYVECSSTLGTNIYLPIGIALDKHFLSRRKE